MDSIFNIFGSHESVKPPTINAQSRVLANKDVLPGKSSITNPGPSRGKKVLSDVRNKILNNKQENRLDEGFTKHMQASFVSKENHGNNGTKSMNIENSIQEKPKSFFDNLLMAADKDINSWPEVENQGPSFWCDGPKDCDLLWPASERPTLDDFYNTANIWEQKEKASSDRSPSPLSISLNDSFEFCFKLPESLAEPALEEPDVPLPWEL